MVLTELDTLQRFGKDSKERLEKALLQLKNGNGIIW